MGEGCASPGYGKEGVNMDVVSGVFQIGPCDIKCATRRVRFGATKTDGPFYCMVDTWHAIVAPQTKLRMLTCNHPVPPDRYNDRVEEHLRRGDRRYRYLNLAHFRKAFDELQEGQFVWVAYAVDRVDPNIIPAEIYMQSVVWTTTVPLVSFECIEWHATDRYRRQFGFLQGVLPQERSLDKAHGEVLTGPKNFNWATTPSHSSWVMYWTNRYNYVLSELPMNSQHPLETYVYWYRSKYGN
ncbi:hypothetical protein Ahy_A05g022520 [Arachis hypogaea]|uniref:Aminotransferase-like plant mobile domain-containing protein n=1 Tax=Arachis hypogaea TaxID=3818 RepID=A0A445D0X1_ARAHY|nr:hypothetical protein Ahy_A05g022520 [Arachis hypogaea]